VLPPPLPKLEVFGLGEEYDRGDDEYERDETDDDRNELPPARPPLEAASQLFRGRANRAPPITKGIASFLQLLKKESILLMVSDFSCLESQSFNRNDSERTHNPRELV